MDISEMIKVLIQIAKFIMLPTARMATAPRTGSTKPKMKKDVRLPFGRIDVLVESVFWWAFVVTQTFRAKSWPTEIVAELSDITLQRKWAQASIRC